MTWKLKIGLFVALSCLTMPFAPAIADSHANVIVFGGSGRLGSEIVRTLVPAGYKVTVFVRPTSDRSRLKGLDVRFLIGDVTSLEDVRGALASNPFDVVIDALARGNAPADFYRVSMQNISAAAAKSGVKQVILHGSVGAGDSADDNSGFNPGMRRVMSAKSAGEQALIASGVHYTIIRNWAIQRHGTPATGRAALSEDRSTRSWITRADLADLTKGCVLAKRCMNKIFHAVDSTP